MCSWHYSGSGQTYVERMYASCSQSFERKYTHICMVRNKILELLFEMHAPAKNREYIRLSNENRIEFGNSHLPVIGCVGISAPLIPCDSNKLFTFEQLVGGFAAAASAPLTSFGVVDVRARFCAAAIVIACMTTETITASCVVCCAFISIFDRFVLDHIVTGCIMLPTHYN